MKVLEGLKIRPLGEDFILVPQSGGKVNFNRLISFNKTAAFLWQEVAPREDFTEADLASLLIEQYGIDGDLAASDAAKIAQKWLDAGIVIKQ